jgi:hypothetical protein
MAKLNLPKFDLKGIFKGLGALRPYVALLWPGVIVLAGAVVLVTALLLGNGLKAKVNKQSIPMASRVRSMLRDAPSLKQADEEKKYEDAYESDANLITRLTIETTQRELLDYSIFPEPKGTSSQLFTRFGDKFRNHIENLIKKVNGGKCPDEVLIQTSIERATGSTRGIGALRRGGALSDTTAQSEVSAIVEQICQSRANAISIYANANIVSGYTFWETYEYSSQEESVKACWFWQLGYWIIEDVFSTVEKMNQDSSGVGSSVVKRITGVGFETPDKLIRGREETTSQEMPKYVTSADEQLTASLTGRLSDETTDVVHFSIIAVVRADSLLSFMHELCSEKEHEFSGYTGEGAKKRFKHNQISILESRVKAVDPKSPEHNYYRYGQEPAVEVELICEYTFNKKGYEPIYPEALKEKETEETSTY